MVKRITITLDDTEYKMWKKVKGTKSWYEFFKDLINLKEDSDCVSTNTIKEHLKGLCDELSKLASSCTPECSREEHLLKFCGGKEEKEILFRLFIIVTNALEKELDGYGLWVLRTLRSAILDLANNDFESAKAMLKDMCDSI